MLILPTLLLHEMHSNFYWASNLSLTSNKSLIPSTFAFDYFHCRHHERNNTLPSRHRSRTHPNYTLQSHQSLQPKHNVWWLGANGHPLINMKGISILVIRNRSESVMHKSYKWILWGPVAPPSCKMILACETHRCCILWLCAVSYWIFCRHRSCRFLSDLVARSTDSILSIELNANFSRLMICFDGMTTPF